MIDCSWLLLFTVVTALQLLPFSCQPLHPYSYTILHVTRSPTGLAAFKYHYLP